jgi:glycosyltransferase involved in cell wall biosynthesis
MSPQYTRTRGREIVFNGKFLAADSTGVHRVAEELMTAAYSHVMSDPDLERQLNIKLWVPANAVKAAQRLGMPYEVIGPLTGIPWEQITLPLRAGNRLIVSLCNVGPIALRNGITMFHDAQVHSSPGSYAFGFRMWYRFHQPLVGHRHRKILTVSDYSKSQIARYGLAPDTRIDVVHNGVDHMCRYGLDRGVLDQFGLQPGRYVVALANTQVHKNVGVLLEAFRDPRLADLKLVLFGSASLPAFQSLGHQVSSNVVFVGRVTDAQLSGLYSSALCMAFPSLTEGFGLPPLEAMVLGCVSMVAPCGALPEVCGEPAIYVDPHSAERWASDISRLALDTESLAQRQAASRQWAQRFTWAAAARRLVATLSAT